MRNTIDYFFTLASPWSYMGLPRFREYAKRSGSHIHYKPVSTKAVFATSGGLPLAERPEPRKAYRLVELERWRLYLDMPLNLQPAYFPVDDSFACHVVIAAVEAGQDVGDLVSGFHRAIWVDEENLADRAVVERIARAHGVDDATLAAAGAEETTARFEANIQDAIKAGAIGVPTYVVDDEIFWGQDRLDFVARKMGLSV